MEISKFIEFAKEAQSVLSRSGYAAEHIYLAGYSKILETDFKPALIFVSNAYDALDLYTRAKLAIKIHKGPLTINYYLFGPEQLESSNIPVTKESLRNAIKIFGKKTLSVMDTNSFQIQSRKNNTPYLEKQN